MPVDRRKHRQNHLVIKWIPFFTALAFCLFSILSSEASGQSADPSVPGHSKRGKVIDFDDDVVEGMNKRPLDSLNQVSERDRKHHKPHLYHKRIGFQEDDRQALKDMRYVP